MKIHESIFGEGVKVDNLDAKQLNELKSEAIDYLKDWPLEVFTLDFTAGDPTDKPTDGDVDSFCIEKVKDLVSLLADGLGWDLDTTKLKDSDINHIFDFLKGMKGEVDSDRQSIDAGGQRSQENVSYKYEIKGWYYTHGQDLIDINGVITQVEYV